ncbi:MAG: DUF4468 domain-containing protein [Bacteroidales bacterium]|nr:DUF4468 domain-containing protein [Bacteroidales bacterium]
MKKLLFSLLFLFPALLFAQNAQNPSDPKYLADAFSYKNGKMYIERKLDVAELNAAQIRSVIGDWLKERYKGENDRVIEPTDQSDSYIVQASEKIRVKIGLFGSNVNFVYNLLITYSDAQCTLQFRGMRFSNNPFSKSPAEFVTAEEYLTEKNSLNKDKTRVSAGIGTYRMGVIDKADEIALDAQKFIDISFKNLVRNNEVSSNAVATAATATAAAATVAAATVKDASVSAAHATTNAATTAANATANAARTAASTVKDASVTAAGATASAAGAVASKVSSAAKKTAEEVKNAVTEKPENTIVSAECVKMIKAGGAAITAIGGKKLGKPVFGNAKYTKLGGTEVIMYKNAANEDNINLLLDMAETFEISIFDGSNRIATFKCKKAESLDDSVMGEVVSKL